MGGPATHEARLLATTCALDLADRSVGRVDRLPPARQAHPPHCGMESSARCASACDLMSASAAGRCTSQSTMASSTCSVARGGG